MLPVAAAVLLWVAQRSPHAREAVGFVAGAGLVVGLLSPLLGSGVIAVALVGYGVSRGRDSVTS